MPRRVGTSARDEEVALSGRGESVAEVCERNSWTACKSKVIT